MQSRAISFATLLLVFVPGVALALSAGDVTVTMNGQSLVPDLQCTPNSFGAQLSCFGQNLAAADSSWTIPSIELHFLGDDLYKAEVVAYFSLRNDLAAAQTFDFLEQRPFTSLSFPVDNQFLGGIEGYLVGDGAVLTDVGSPIFTGLIDGSPVQTLLAAPQTITTDFFVGNISESLTVTPLSSVGQEVRFALSPGDLVAFRVIDFGVSTLVVPEPATLWLLAAGLAGTATFRRRAAPPRASSQRT